MFAALLSGLSYSLTLHGPLKDYGGNQRQKWKYASFGIVITHRLLAEVLGLVLTNCTLSNDQRADTAVACTMPTAQRP